MTNVLIQHHQSHFAADKNKSMLLGSLKTATIILLSLACGMASANHVRCTCPNISAQATGSTSCSASESNGKCTVAFNEFDQNLEAAAKRLLEIYTQRPDIRFNRFPAIVGSSEQRGMTQPNAQWLSKQGKNAVVDQIMIYALVTLIQSGNYEGKQWEVAAVHKTLRDHASRISKIFVAGGTPYWDNKVRVKHGCLSFKIGNMWGMYKSSWSSSVENQRC